MSVLVEAINIIVKKDTLIKKYPGGVKAYKSDCPNETYCADDHLTRIGFLSSSRAQSFIDRLTALGFVFYDGEQFVDVAVVDKSIGPTAPCDWLTVAKYPEGFTRCWLAGSEDQRTVFPAGRTPESIQAANLFLLPEDDSQNYECSRYSENPITLYGQQGYAARIPKHQVRPYDENARQVAG